MIEIPTPGTNHYSRRQCEVTPIRSFRVIGVDSSPYTAKVRAVMRYRHVPHRWLCRFPQMHEETRHIRPPLMPMVQFPDGEYRTDSTPIIYQLEDEHPGRRSVIPDDPGLAFVSHLIEDMADEWLTKCLFHYRFATQAAGEFAAEWVMDDTSPGLGRASLLTEAENFRARQIARMPLVGVTPSNAATIERSYHRTLRIMESFVANERFLLGTRPSLGDFGLYAQLRTLGIDPVGLSIMRTEAPRTEHWLRRIDDASGVEGEWIDWAASLPQPVEQLLAMAGDTYLPYLAANERALEAGSSQLEVTLDGSPFRARSFAYQAKCLRWLREELQAVPERALKRIRPTLEFTRCWEILQR